MLTLVDSLFLNYSVTAQRREWLCLYIANMISQALLGISCRENSLLDRNHCHSWVTILSYYDVGLLSLHIIGLIGIHNRLLSVWWHYLMRLWLHQLIRVLANVLKKFASFFIFIVPLLHIELWLLSLKSFEHDLILAGDLNQLPLANSYIKTLLVLFCRWVEDSGLLLLLRL